MSEDKNVQEKNGELQNRRFEEKVHDFVVSYGISDDNVPYVILIGSASVGGLVLYNIRTILAFIYYMIYWVSCIGVSFGASAVIVSFIHRIDRGTVVDFFERDDELLRLEFQNSNYEEMFELMNNESETDTEAETETESTTKTVLESLKEKDNHFVVDIPFHPAKKVIMYYDATEDAFLYYTKNSDLMLPHLNAICRMYCLKYKTPELYVDTDDIDFMNTTYGKTEQDDENDADTEDDKKSSVKKDSFVEIGANNENNKDSEKNETSGWSSIFARPKAKAIQETVQEKEDKEEEEEDNDSPKYIKYKKMGLISDYEFDNSHKNSGNSNVSYKSFIHQALNMKMD